MQNLVDLGADANETTTKVTLLYFVADNCVGVHSVDTVKALVELGSIWILRMTFSTFCTSG